MLKLTGVFILSIAAKVLASGYYWDPTDNVFDCVVSIEYKYSIYTWLKLSAGVFIRKNLIAASFAPTFYAGYYSTGYHRRFHMINGSYKDSMMSVAVDALYDNRFQIWVQWGTNSYKENPTVDIIFYRTSIEVESGLKLKTGGGSKESDNRKPIYFPVAKKYAIEEPSNWMTAAFALTDKKHVNDSNRLIPVYYNEPVLLDCNEWFPKSWGHLICIMNLDNYPVIQSGAPLIQNGYVFGIASFTLKRGKDSLFVFTDLRPYRDIIYNKLPTLYSG